MESEIYQVPRAHVTFTKAEVDVLYECATAHYDATCRSLAIPGPGAIINGLRVKGKEDSSAELWSRDIDLLCKVLEKASFVYLNHPESMATAAGLMMSLGRLFKEMNHES